MWCCRTGLFWHTGHGPSSRVTCRISRQDTRRVHRFITLSLAQKSVTLPLGLDTFALYWSDRIFLAVLEADPVWELHLTLLSGPQIMSLGQQGDEACSPQLLLFLWEP